MEDDTEHIPDIQKCSFSTEAPQPSASSFTTTCRLLYLSHGFAQLSEACWQFSMIVFLSAFCHYSSLTLVASYGLFLNMAVCTTSTSLGQWLDLRRQQRWESVRLLMGMETLAVVCGTACCFVFLSNKDDESEEDVPQYTVTAICSLAGIFLCGAMAQVMDKALAIAIERDWLVVIGQEHAAASEQADKSALFSQFLSNMNVTMRQIAMTCKVTAPAVAGALLSIFQANENDGRSLRWAAVGIGVLNTVSITVEYSCTAAIYRRVPGLSGVDNSFLTDDSGHTDEETHHEEDEEDELATTDRKQENHRNCCCISILKGLRQYLDQPVALAGVSLSCLYVNPLTFGNGIVTTYLLHRGVSLHGVGILRGISSGVGLLGTLAFPFLHRSCSSLETLGLGSIMYQCSCLSLTILAVIRDDTQSSVPLLVGGIWASRVGLWVFDISVTQLQQEQIADDLRGVAGGVQQSLNSMCTIISFTLGIVCSSSEQFIDLVWASFGSVCVGVCLMALFVIPSQCYPNHHTTPAMQSSHRWTKIQQP